MSLFAEERLALPRDEEVDLLWEGLTDELRFPDPPPPDDDRQLCRAVRCALKLSKLLELPLSVVKSHEPSLPAPQLCDTIIKHDALMVTSIAMEITVTGIAKACLGK